jgi:acyl-CoA synthetase (AMP-forming)/AMP-acid ligase II
MIPPNPPTHLALRPKQTHAQALLRESQQAGERLQKEYNSLAERAARLHHSLEDHIHTNTQLLADNSQRQVEIKAKEDEIRALRVGARLCVRVGGGGGRGGGGCQRLKRDGRAQHAAAACFLAAFLCASMPHSASPRALVCIFSSSGVAAGLFCAAPAL